MTKFPRMILKSLKLIIEFIFRSNDRFSYAMRDHHLINLRRVFHITCMFRFADSFIVLNAKAFRLLSAFSFLEALTKTSDRSPSMMYIAIT